MISHSVEISIAGGGGEMVRDPNSCFFFFCFLYHLAEATSLARAKEMLWSFMRVRLSP